MDADLALVIGIVMALLSFPMILQAYTHGTGFKSSSLLLLVGVVMIIFAVNKQPGGYSWDQVPGVFVKVIGGFV
jgi:hypothetical protein